MRNGARCPQRHRVVVLSFLLLGAVAAIAATQQRGPWAPAYPGSVAGDPGGLSEYRSFYLTRDPHSAVVEFYQRHRGASPTPGSAGSSFFQYSSSTFEVNADDGVFIYSNAGRSEATNAVLRKLERLLYDTHGVIDRAEYNRIVSRFGDMAARYPLSDQRDAAGSPVPLDRLLLQRYEQRYDAFIGEAPETDDSAEARFNALIAQGRFQEAAEVMRGHSGDVIGVHQREKSREVVDLWISCLEEMERHAYPVVIHIGHRR